MEYDGIELNLEDFDSFMEKLHSMAVNTPDEVAKGFRIVGKECAKVGRKVAKELVKKGKPDKENAYGKKSYHKGFKGSKCWIDGDDIKVSVYNKSPHAHLIEYGHAMVTKNGRVGFVEGRYVLKKAQEIYSNSQEFKYDLEKVVVLALKKGGIYD